MIIINYKGRLGNQLFQYMTAKILSDLYERNIGNPLSTTIIKQPNIYPEFRAERGWMITDDNIVEIFNNLDPKKHKDDLYIETFCQSSFISNLFNENRHHLIQYNPVENNDVFVHVRLGDILDIRYNLPFEHYDSILGSINFDNGYISSDSMDHDIVRILSQKYNLKPYNNTPEETIKFASNFKYKVLSSGTFSWWIGFLGCQDNVFVPDYNKYPKWMGDIYTIKQWNYI